MVVTTVAGKESIKEAKLSNHFNSIAVQHSSILEFAHPNVAVRLFTPSSQVWFCFFSRSSIVTAAHLLHFEEATSAVI
jgi:hypothetical protein